ncbi:transposase [Streptomyces klenkii]|uniref:transposase n=1 Tax=Streptomyces klenkii TaxID=1420899 RepID=UPI0036F172CC
MKSELAYSRGPEKTWVCGELQVRDGKQVTMTAFSRNSVFYQKFLKRLETANPTGGIYVITNNLSSHNSLSTRTWREDHPRIHHVFIPVGTCWLNLQEGWWRIFRKTSLAGPVIRRTSSDRPRHPIRDHPAQHAHTAVDLGQTPTHPQPANYDADMCTPLEESSSSYPGH